MSNRPIPKSSKLVILGLVVVSIAGCGPSPNQGGWETKFIGKTGMIGDGPDGSVLVGNPKDINDQATIQINDTFYENTECRIIAIDRWGKVHIGKQSSKLVPERKYRSTEAVFPDLTLNDIKEFQFQTQLYEQKTEN
jgi:hypothetical protein